MPRRFHVCFRFAAGAATRLAALPDRRRASLLRARRGAANRFRENRIADYRVPDLFRRSNPLEVLSTARRPPDIQIPIFEPAGHNWNTIAPRAAAAGGQPVLPYSRRRLRGPAQAFTSKSEPDRHRARLEYAAPAAKPAHKGAARSLASRQEIHVESLPVFASARRSALLCEWPRSW